MKHACYLLLFFLFLSCTKNEKVTYRLTDEQLAQVMFDIHFADVLLPTLTIVQRDSVKNIYWKRMSQLYNLPEEEIRAEIKKLETEPEKFKLILTRVKEMADSIP